MSNRDGSNGQRGFKTALSPSVDSTPIALRGLADPFPRFLFAFAGRVSCNWVVR
ncbi:MAG: hypothetical protein ACK59R_00885 [Pseudomonadota bacterium]